MGTHYDTLGVGRTAAAREITRAYRRLARLHHPDVSDDPVDVFLSIQAAYDTLSDARRRAEYDTELRLREEPIAPPPVSPPTVVPTVRRSSPAQHRVRLPSGRRAAAAVVIAAASVAVLPASLVLAGTAPLTSRLLWVGVGSLLALVGSSSAHSVAERQIDRLRRLSLIGADGDLTLESRRRIRLGAKAAMLGRPLVLLAILLAVFVVRR